ncbi:MAG: EamA family transporter [Oceanicaulis sp.]|nr:EamA family transporter [Oceanicaulis sp.]
MKLAARSGASFWFAAVCCESAYTLLGKTLTKNMDPVLVAFLASALSIPLFVPLAVWQWPSFTPSDFDAGVWTALVWYGVGTLALGSWLSGMRAFRRLKAPPRRRSWA